MILVTGGAYQGKLAFAQSLPGREGQAFADGALCETAADSFDFGKFWHSIIILCYRCFTEMIGGERRET